MKPYTFRNTLIDLELISTITFSCNRQYPSSYLEVTFLFGAPSIKEHLSVGSGYAGGEFKADSIRHIDRLEAEVNALKEAYINCGRVIDESKLP